MRSFKYHAMANTKDYVAFSTDAPVKGWFKPSDTLGVCVIGHAETVKPLAEAEAYIAKLVARGDQITRGKDISQAGGAELVRAYKGHIQRQTW